MFSSQTIVAGPKKVDLSPRAAPPGNWLKEDLQEARDLLNALPKTAKGAIARGKALPEREPIGESERTVFLARMCFCIFAGTAFLPGPARSAEGFIRGDVDGSLRLEITDAIRIFQFLFLGQAGGVVCQDAADVDDNGAVELTDGVYLLSFLFRQGSPPPAPFPECGADPTEDPVGCDQHEGCKFLVWGGFTADGVFFVVDRSGAMQDSGELSVAKRDIIRTLSEFSEQVHFGIVFFDANVVKFPASGAPAEANPGMKAAATSFVQSASGGSGTCVQKGFAAALNFLDASPAKKNIIIYVGDGRGTCSGSAEHTYLKQTVDFVTQRNNGRARIHTFGVLDLGRIQENFLKDLAAKNGGTYTRITR